MEILVIGTCVIAAASAAAVIALAVKAGGPAKGDAGGGGFVVRVVEVVLVNGAVAVGVGNFLTLGVNVAMSVVVGSAPGIAK